MTAEDSMWVIGPLAIALLAHVAGRRWGLSWMWVVVVTPYTLLGGVYANRAYAAVASGFRFVDGSPLAVTWNAAGVALFLGTVAHVGVKRRWSLIQSTVLAGLAGIVPAVFGFMGAGAILGAVGAALTIGLHLARPVSPARHDEPAF